jgi:SAM-dependent methyltransferase
MKRISSIFSVHPRELQRRRKRCRAAVLDLRRFPRAPHGCCNVCEGRETVLLCNSDRYGMQVRTVMCRRCGLIYLLDRLSAEAYREFYASGTYRSLTEKFSGQTARVKALQRDQVGYAARVIQVLENFAEIPEQRFLLDVGGSAGLVASSVSAHFGCAPTVLDPAAEEIAAAKASGLEGIVGSLETYQPHRTFDIILLCRSVEHLFDLRFSLSKIRSLLSPGGLFYCDIVDFVETCRTGGGPQAITKIDHCYWLSQETAPLIFGAAGFEVVAMDVSAQCETIGYLLRPGQQVRPARAPEAVVDFLVRRLREINSDWLSSGTRPLSVADRLRHMAYRANRKIKHFADAHPFHTNSDLSGMTSRPACVAALALNGRNKHSDSYSKPTSE